jgi:hypothetical protein
MLSFQREFNKTQLTDSFIEKKHLCIICSIFVSVLRISIQVEVTNNKPIKKVRHIYVFKPIQKIPFTIRGTWSINISQDPNSTIVKRCKFNRGSIGILKDLLSLEKCTFPQDNCSLDAPTEGK